MSHIYRRRLQKLFRATAKKVLTNVVNEKLEKVIIPKWRELSKLSGAEVEALAKSLGVVMGERMEMLSAINDIRKAAKNV